MIKKREAYRPFAPVVLEEYVEKIYELPNEKQKYPYMVFTFKVKEEFKDKLGAVTHVDGTARIQTISQNENPKFWRLIEQFYNITGIPVVLNTSFNNNVEPIVNYATDCIVSFL